MRTPACPICGGTDLRDFVQRSGVPAGQNITYPDRASALAAPTGELRVAVCSGCGFAHNRLFDPGLAEYDPRYENDQTKSAAFSAHVDEMAERVLGAGGGAPVQVVEVGCGQGYFLERLVARAGGRLTKAIGFDPAYRGETGGAGLLRFERRIFDEESAAEIESGRRLLLTRHVIEHVADPVGFLVGIREAMEPGSRLFVETPCLEWIFRTGTMQDIFYEHCSYFTAGTLQFALHRAGLFVHRVDHVFGGQYLWAEAQFTCEPQAEPVVPDAAPVVEAAAKFARTEVEWIARWSALLTESPTPVALWGAGAKGVTFAHMLDPRGEAIDCLVDVNPGKQGSFVPATGHPILSWPAAAERRIATVVVMNPLYRDEIAADVAATDLNVRFLEA